MRRPRVLLIQHAVYPYRRPVFDELGRHFDLTVFFCLEAKAFRRWDTSAMFADPPFAAGVLPGIRIGWLVLNRGLSSALWRGGFDAVVVGTIDFITLPQVVTLLSVGRLRGIPLVICEEFFPTPWYKARRPIVSRLAIATRKFVYARSAAFAAWNRKAEAFLAAAGAPPERIFGGSHWYPPPEPPSALPDPFPGRRVVLCVGYLRQMRKGIDILIRAFRALPQDALLVIVGGGEDEAALRREAEGDERIVFAGHLDDAAKRPFLRHAYLVAVPSRWDAWNLVVNEAAYHHVPVVVSDGAGVSDTVAAAGNGVVVAAGDEAALGRAIAALLDDRDRRDELARRSGEFLALASLEGMARAVIDAVEAALVPGWSGRRRATRRWSRWPSPPATTSRGGTDTLGCTATTSDVSSTATSGR
jgi:glycosyltransferase involved in cell wall biosynthesis